VVPRICDDGTDVDDGADAAAMPFDLSSHPDANAPVARITLARLQQDLLNYQSQASSRW
jgi:hypothetical protein